MSDMKVKEKMKKNKDKKSTVREHNIMQGDQVLLRRNASKHQSEYDPDPYTAIQVTGTQIQGEREGETKTRHAQRWKRYEPWEQNRSKKT